MRVCLATSAMCEVSVPPLCTVAFFWNVWRAPPQYQSFDDANPFPRECPPPDYSDNGLDKPDDPALYEYKTGEPRSIISDVQQKSQLGARAGVNALAKRPLNGATANTARSAEVAAGMTEEVAESNVGEEEGVSVDGAGEGDVVAGELPPVKV